jgi:hypothetical protein
VIVATVPVNAGTARATGGVDVVVGASVVVGDVSGRVVVDDAVGFATVDVVVVVVVVVVVELER